MNVLARLARNEWTKTRKRPVFYITLGLFFFIDLLGFGYNLREALKAGDESFALPGQWAQILGEASNVPLIFASVVVLLVVANEFSWRTARQNVIDGLTRTEWYWGKAIAATMIVCVFAATHVALGGGLALVGTPAGTDGLFTGAHAATMTGFLLAALGYAAMALLAGTLVRSAGAAMAVWFFYVVIAEGLLRAGIGRVWEAAQPALAFAPVHTFGRVHDPLMYDSAALATATARAVAAGRPPPEVGDPTTVMAATVLWVVGLTVVGWLIFRRRDL